MVPKVVRAIASERERERERQQMRNISFLERIIYLLNIVGIIAVTCMLYNLQPLCRTAMYDRTCSDECAEERSMIVPVLNAMVLIVIWLSVLNTST